LLPEFLLRHELLDLRSRCADVLFVRQVMFLRKESKQTARIFAVTNP